MAEHGRDIVTPSASKDPVWNMKDLTTGRAAVGEKAMCKLCLLEVTHSGRTTNLKNHLRSHHRPEYRNLYGDDLAEVQSQPKMDVFCKPVVPWRSCLQFRRECKN